MKRFLWLVLVAVLAAACGGATAVEPEAFNGTLMPTPIPVTDFTLTAVGDTPVGLRDFGDKTVLLYFGYTFCPDVCPTTMADLGRVQREIDDSGEQIQVVMITVDPERDTPELLADYVTHFHPTFVGLSGTPEEIAQVAQDFGVFYERHEGSEASGYLVDHTARVFVVEPDGTYRLSFGYGMSATDIAADLQRLQSLNQMN